MNRDSVMAMLEAFVHDPLINWRLLNTTDADADNALSAANTSDMPGLPPLLRLGLQAKSARTPVTQCLRCSRMPSLST